MEDEYEGRNTRYNSYSTKYKLFRTFVQSRNPILDYYAAHVFLFLITFIFHYQRQIFIVFFFPFFVREKIDNLSKTLGANKLIKEKISENVVI